MSYEVRADGPDAVRVVTVPAQGLAYSGDMDMGHEGFNDTAEDDPTGLLALQGSAKLIIAMVRQRAAQSGVVYRDGDRISCTVPSKTVKGALSEVSLKIANNGNAEVKVLDNLGSEVPDGDIGSFPFLAGAQGTPTHIRVDNYVGVPVDGDQSATDWTAERLAEIQTAIQEGTAQWTVAPT